MCVMCFTIVYMSGVLLCSACRLLCNCYLRILSLCWLTISVPYVCFAAIAREYVVFMCHMCSIVISSAQAYGKAFVAAWKWFLVTSSMRL